MRWRDILPREQKRRFILEVYMYTYLHIYIFSDFSAISNICDNNLSYIPVCPLFIPTFSTEYPIWGFSTATIQFSFFVFIWKLSTGELFAITKVRLGGPRKRLPDYRRNYIKICFSYLAIKAKNRVLFRFFLWQDKNCTFFQ